MAFRTLSSALLLTALASGCAPSFEAELAEVVVTQRGLRLPAVPATTTGCDVSTSGAFSLSSSETGWAKKMNSEVRVHQVGIAAGPGLASLDFIKVARVTVVADGRPETTTEILSYYRDAAAPAPSASAIQVSPPAPIDITIPWTSDKTVVSVQVAGQLPTQDWTVDLTLTLSGKITYEY